MDQNELPLQDFFNQLRDHGFLLGVDEYMAVLRALQAGYGIETRQSLKKLCKILWVKNDEELQIFNRLFDQVMVEVKLEMPTEPSKPVSSPPEMDRADTPPSQDVYQPPVRPEEESTPDLPSSDSTIEVEEPVQIVQAFRSRGKFPPLVTRPKYSWAADYFPVTRRQIKQSLRHLRRSVREGPLEEIDIEATVEKISREGVFSAPVLLPRRSNRAKLALLVDQDGSMVPFHALTRQFVNTVYHGGRLQETKVYYFHDYPADFLYVDAPRLQEKFTHKVLEDIGEHTTVLLISDAGAARGNVDVDRIKQTRIFIQTLRHYVRRFAWVNPMPHFRWPNTSAGEIAKFVPMFEMSRQGLDDAVNALRGRYVYWEKLYPWMI